MEPEPKITQNALFKIAIRRYLFHENLDCSWLFGDSAYDLIPKIWDDCGGGDSDLVLKDSGEPRLEPTEELGGSLVRIICLPPPTRIAENHFVAVAYRPARRSWLPPLRREATLRCLALEYGIDLEGQPRTVLGEWTSTGHINYGDGPVPRLDLFREALSQMLRGAVRPVAVYISPKSPRGSEDVSGS